MKKKILIIAIIATLTIALFVLTGCGNNSTNEKSDNTSNQTETTETTQKPKGNYDVFESIKKINTTTTLEEINEVMGFEGEVKTESDETSTFKWKIYVWNLTEDTSIEVRIYDDSDDVSISAYYPDDMIKNSKVDFSKTDEMKSKIDSTEGLKYEEIVEMLGGVEGTLDKKDSSTDTYVWCHSDGGSFTARFSTRTGKCTSINGVF